MSNTYVIHDARLCADPEQFAPESGSTVTTLRLADNGPHGKDEKRPARFVKAKIWGKAGDTALKLRKGDVITVSGQLGVEAFGEDLAKRADVMRVDSYRVQKSETFYEGGEDRPAETSGTKATGRKGKTTDDPFAG